MFTVLPKTGAGKMFSPPTAKAAATRTPSPAKPSASATPAVAAPPPTPKKAPAPGKVAGARTLEAASTVKKPTRPKKKGVPQKPVARRHRTAKPVGRGAVRGQTAPLLLAMSNIPHSDKRTKELIGSFVSAIIGAVLQKACGVTAGTKRQIVKTSDIHYAFTSTVRNILVSEPDEGVAAPKKKRKKAVPMETEPEARAEAAPVAE